MGFCTRFFFGGGGEGVGEGGLYVPVIINITPKICYFSILYTYQRVIRRAPLPTIPLPWDSPPVAGTTC